MASMSPPFYAVFDEDGFLDLFDSVEVARESIKLTHSRMNAEYSESHSHDLSEVRMEVKTEFGVGKFYIKSMTPKDSPEHL